MKSGFATINGCKDTLGRYDIPYEWWSRKYEYPWVAEQIAKSDVVLDAGCGITHCFKYWLAENCKQVMALDSDKRILEISKLPANLTPVHGNMTSRIFTDNIFNKIVCISVLEHTSKNIKVILDEFARVLKPDGRLIVTLDVPTIRMSDWKQALKHSRFIPDTCDGNMFDWNEPPNILIEPNNILDINGKATGVGGKNLRVFCCRLVLDGDTECL